jgi:hypothetical protein
MILARVGYAVLLVASFVGFVFSPTGTWLAVTAFFGLATLLSEVGDIWVKSADGARAELELARRATAEAKEALTKAVEAGLVLERRVASLEGRALKVETLATSLRR